MRDSTIRNNVGAGIYVGASGVVVQAAISDVRLLGNERGLQAAGGTLASFMNNRVTGNTVTDGTPTLTLTQM